MLKKNKSIREQYFQRTSTPSFAQENIHHKPTNKRKEKRIGFFPLTAQINTVAFRAPMVCLLIIHYHLIGCNI